MSLFTLDEVSTMPTVNDNRRPKQESVMQINILGDVIKKMINDKRD